MRPGSTSARPEPVVSVYGAGLPSTSWQREVRTFTVCTTTVGGAGRPLSVVVCTGVPSIATSRPPRPADQAKVRRAAG
ncbi:hypothetical protein ACWD1W_13665 [Streptomyces olivaceoviridis]